MTLLPGKRSAAKSDAQASRLVSSKPTAASSPATSTVTLLTRKEGYAYQDDERAIYAGHTHLAVRTYE